MADEAGFEVMITTDKGIPYQQNLGGRRLALSWLSLPMTGRAFGNRNLLS